MLQLLVFVGILSVHTVAAKGQLDQLSKMGVRILDSSRLPGTIRQCSCAEERSCVDEGIGQVMQCSAGCYGSFSSVTRNPMGLKACIDQKSNILQQFLSCIMSEGQSCTNNPFQPQVPHYDFNRAIQLANAQLNANRGSILNSGMLRNIKPVGNAAIDFGMCTQGCFTSRNRGGFCFDRRGCNPLISEKKAKRAVKSCLKRMNWKQHAGQLCDCAMRVGVSGLERFCPILRLMSSP